MDTTARACPNACVDTAHISLHHKHASHPYSRHQDVVDWDVDKLDEETNETHNEEPNGGGFGHLHELCAKNERGERRANRVVRRVRCVNGMERVAKSHVDLTARKRKQDQVNPRTGQNARKTRAVSPLVPFRFVSSGYISAIFMKVMVRALTRRQSECAPTSYCSVVR